MFEGTQLTQLVPLVTAGRLFIIYKGQVNPLKDVLKSLMDVCGKSRINEMELSAQTRDVSLRKRMGNCKCKLRVVQTREKCHMKLYVRNNIIKPI